MSLSFSDWQAKLKTRWRAWAQNPEAALDALGANTLYFGLGGVALYPVAEAVARGDLAALGLLYSLGAGVGVNLIANAVQGWADESDTAAKLAQTASTNPELVSALDAILQKLDAVSEVERGLSARDRAWFQQTLQREVVRLGSKLTVGAVINTGSGGIGIGEATVAGAGGVAVRGDVHGDVLVNSTKIVYTGDDPKAAQELLHRYLKWVVADCAPLRLKAIDQGAARPGQQPLGLANVYVDLNLDMKIPGVFTFASYMQVAERSPGEVHTGPSKVRQVSILEALAYHPKFVLLGAPGSGKSTFSAYVALSLAQAGLGSEEALKRLGAEWTHGPLLPVRVTLRQFSASLPADLKQGRAAHLWRFIAGELVNCGLPEKAGPLLQDVAQKSGALFLLDGLDEAGDADHRARVLEAVAEFISTAGEACHFIITARPYAWEDAEQRLANIPFFYRLADFDEAQIQTFITRWYEAIAAAGWVNAAEADDKTRNLQTAVERVDLQPLARNPLLLTLMATLHSNRTRLPEDRADLYNEVVELLLQRWNEPSGADRSLLDALQIPTLTLANLRDIVERLAFEAHESQERDEGLADIAEAVLLETFRPLLNNSRDKAALVVDYIEKRAGLLVGQGARGKIRQFTFPHRTFHRTSGNRCHN